MSLEPSIESDDFESRLPRPSRKMSLFIAEGFLYDFIDEKLDRDRKQAIDGLLEGNQELCTELQKMRKAQIYLSQLSQTRISEKHLTELREVKRMSEIAINKTRLSSWPEPLRWAFEAMLVSLAVAVLALLFPWAEMGTKFSGLSSQLVLNEPKVQVTQIDVPPLPAAEVSEQVAATAAPAEQKIKNVDSKETIAKVLAPAPVIADESIAEAKRLPVTQDKKVTKGLLYRLKMNFSDSESISPSVREQILSFGGAKAGEVELGWRKEAPAGNYFHFTLPENNYQQFITTLGAYGPVRIFKQPHERIMPEGQIRIILWIEDEKK